MLSVFRSLLLLIHTCAVLAENVAGACERHQDGVECAETSDDDSYFIVRDETRASENIEGDQ